MGILFCILLSVVMLRSQGCQANENKKLPESPDGNGSPLFLPFLVLLVLVLVSDVRPLVRLKDLAKDAILQLPVNVVLVEDDRRQRGETRLPLHREPKVSPPSAQAPKESRK